MRRTEIWMKFEGRGREGAGEGRGSDGGGRGEGRG